MGLFDYGTYIIDGQLLKLRRTMLIKDEKGNGLGKAVKKFFSVSEEIEFFDNQERKVGVIRRKLVSVRPTYEVYDQYDRHVASIKKKVVSIGDHWWVESPKGERILGVDGNIMGVEYRIKDKFGREVAEVSKSFLSIRDQYGVRIIGDVDPLLVLAVVAAIDLEKTK